MKKSIWPVACGVILVLAINIVGNMLVPPWDPKVVALNEAVAKLSAIRAEVMAPDAKLEELLAQIEADKAELKRLATEPLSELEKFEIRVAVDKLWD